MPDKRVNGGFLGIIYAKLGLVSIDQRAVGHLPVPDMGFIRSFVVHNRIFEDGRDKLGEMIYSRLHDMICSLLLGVSCRLTTMN